MYKSPCEKWFFDAFTYSGLIRIWLFCVTISIFLWYVDILFSWFYGLFNGTFVADESDIGWHRFLAASSGCYATLLIFMATVNLYIERRGCDGSPDSIRKKWELHQQWKLRQQAEAKRWKKKIKIELHEPEEEAAPPAVPAEPVDVPISSEHEIRLPGMEEGAIRETGALPMRLEVPAGQDATASPKLVGHYHSGTNRIVLARRHQGRASSKGWHRGSQRRGTEKGSAAAGRKKGPRGVRAKRNTTDRSRSYCRKKGKELSWPERRCRPWRSGHPDWT